MSRLCVAADFREAIVVRLSGNIVLAIVWGGVITFGHNVVVRCGCLGLLCEEG